MPADFILRRSRAILDDIGYSKSDFKFSVSQGEIFKNKIIDGAGIEIKVVGDSEFMVVIGDSSYYGSLATSYYYSRFRVQRQLDAVKSLIEARGAPSAWILVSAYYAAFYAATEISRICSATINLSGQTTIILTG